MSVVIKILFILGMAVVPAIPFILEYITFWRECSKKIGYRRFWSVVYTAAYIVVVTVVLCLANQFLSWLGSLSFVRQIVSAVAIGDRVAYLAEVFAAILLNFAIGMLYWLLGRAVHAAAARISLTEPRKEDGEFSLLQKIERKAIEFYHRDACFFAGTILKYLNIVLSAVYFLFFVASQFPGVFGADWIPYEFISMLFGAGYIYPTIALLGLWALYFFFAGLKRLEEECPALLHREGMQLKKTGVDLKAIAKELGTQFSAHYERDLIIPDVQESIASSAHTPVTRLIAQAVERDPRAAQKHVELYLDVLDKLTAGEKSLLINGSFFSGFTMYFLRYLSAVLARGDNVIIVCNSEMQIDAAAEYVRQGFCSISSLYYREGKARGIDLDEPIWQVSKVSGEYSAVRDASVEDGSVLVTSLGYLCSDRFAREYSKFVLRLDAVVFVDMLATVNTFNRQLAILNTTLLHLIGVNAAAAVNGDNRSFYSMRYRSKKMRYICFDSSRTPGLDKVVKNMLGVEFDSADAMYYNAKTLVCCYRYDRKPDENGRSSYRQFLRTEEEIGVVMNMALLCLAKGAGNVTVFTDDALPYANIVETIAANRGGISIRASENNIRLNRHFYDPKEYSVVIAVDPEDNLPAAVRKYVSMLSGEEALLIVFSRPYLLREYYVENLDEIWAGRQVQRIPVEEGTPRDAAQRILVKANTGGIGRAEVLRLAAGVPYFEAAVARKDVNDVLRKALEVYGVPQEERSDLFRYFEFIYEKTFGEAGKFTADTKIILRREGRLFESVSGRSMAVMETGAEQIVLPVPRSRLTQRYIAGQNMICKGNIYHIYNIDAKAGKVYARLAVAGNNNEAYEYVQAREYRLQMDASAVQEVCPRQHVILRAQQGSICIEEACIAVLRVPMEVVTSGYYELDPHTGARNGVNDRYYSLGEGRICRRYGSIAEPSAASEVLAYEQGASVMSLRIGGIFGKDVNKTMQLAAAMLGELLRSLFPSVADSLAVCPVLQGEPSGSDAAEILQKQPKLTLTGGADDRQGFRLLIIEDSPTDLGVVSGLMSAGDDVLRAVFGPIFKYLQWYISSGKPVCSLYGGRLQPPDCFDFDSLYDLSALLADNKHDIEFKDVNSVMQYDVCDFCGRRYAKGEEVGETKDGRKMCTACLETLVSDKKTLKLCADRVRIFLDSIYGVCLPDNFQPAFASADEIEGMCARGGCSSIDDVRLRACIDRSQNIFVECPIPAENLPELLAREAAHLWQLQNLPDLPAKYTAGLMALVSVQYLRFLGSDMLAAARVKFYEGADTLSGEGYRALARELRQRPQCNNDPFRCVQELCGVEYEERTAADPQDDLDKYLGAPYKPSAPDRAVGGAVKYFYYERLTEPLQRVYDAILQAALEHRGEAEGGELDAQEIFRAKNAVKYDHPELFWFKTVSVSGSKILLQYGATKAEADALQKQIDASAAKYLEGIRDDMSAYDVALRIHLRMIAEIDYDTIALERQQKEGGCADDKIDYLRTICGPFLRGTAVCEGYARAVQYLLQKCGVECAEVAGMIRSEDPEEKDEAHAWNILKADGDYYYSDTTWDDRSDTVQTVKVKDFGFNYFCVTTAEIERTREIDLCPADMPDCTAVKCNYYVHNDLLLRSYDADTVKQIAKAAAQKHVPFFTVKCAGKELFKRVQQQLCADGRDCFEALKAAAKIDKTIAANSFSYNYDEKMRTITIIFKYTTEK